MGTPQAPGIMDIRETVRDVVGERAVSPQSAAAARESLLAIFQEASKHGLTVADVIRSVLSPVLKITPGCNCATCRSRRAALELHNSLEQAGGESGVD